MAVAIAEGNLNPCTMEAFDRSPQPGYKHSFRFPDSSSHHSTQEEAAEPMQEGCFTIVSSHKAIKKRIRGDMPLDAMKRNREDGKKTTATITEVLHKSETLALKKLGLSSQKEASKDKEALLGSAPEVPCNNPFKIRKNDKLQVDQTITEEQASEVTEIEESEILSATQKSEETIDSDFIEPKRRRTGEKLSKQSDGNHVKCKRSSILSFFSRV